MYSEAHFYKVLVFSQCFQIVVVIAMVILYLFSKPVYFVMSYINVVEIGKGGRGRRSMRWEDCVKRSDKRGRRMGKNSKRQKEMETVDRERS